MGLLEGNDGSETRIGIARKGRGAEVTYVCASTPSGSITGSVRSSFLFGFPPSRFAPARTPSRYHSTH